MIKLFLPFLRVRLSYLETGTCFFSYPSLSFFLTAGHFGILLTLDTLRRWLDEVKGDDIYNCLIFLLMVSSFSFIRWLVTASICQASCEVLYMCFLTELLRCL